MEFASSTWILSLLSECVIISIYRQTYSIRRTNPKTFFLSRLIASSLIGWDLAKTEGITDVASSPIGWNLPKRKCISYVTSSLIGWDLAKSEDTTYAKFCLIGWDLANRDGMTYLMSFLAGWGLTRSSSCKHSVCVRIGNPSLKWFMTLWSKSCKNIFCSTFNSRDPPMPYATTTQTWCLWKCVAQPVIMFRVIRHPTHTSINVLLTEKPFLDYTPTVTSSLIPMPVLKIKPIEEQCM